MVRWLQLGAAATGIGVALLAAPGIASADVGADSSTATSSHSSATGGSTARAVASADRHAVAGRRTPAAAPARPSARAAKIESAMSPVAKARSTTGRIGKIPDVTDSVTASAPSVTTGSSVTPTAQASAARVDVRQSIQSISDALQQFLAGAANRLSGLPSTPVNTFLQDALYLVRRTLFPASVGVVTRPIKVPLYFQAIDNAGTQKLGIYVSLGYGAPPQLFEFDTGAGGFYAAYASADPATASPWWGAGVTTSSQQVHDSFDSGLTYSGYAATGTVSLYTVGSSTPLVTSGQVTVGQMDSITNKDGQPVWTSAGSAAPPIDNAFYGDFGMAPTYQANSIDQVIAQLTFARGITPGYLVHVDPVTGQAWMQIGLTQSNVANSQGMYFPMLPDDKADGATFLNSGLHFYGLQLFDAGINIIDRNGSLLINDPNVGITPDTGATTTLHNTDLSPDPQKYNSIIDWEPGSTTVGKLKTGMLFWLTGTTTGQTPVRYFQFVTTDQQNAGKVKVQDVATNDPVTDLNELYYLNTGIALFYAYDVVYDLGNKQGNGTLGLIPHGATSA